MKKRMLGIMLSLCMILSLLPMSALAANTPAERSNEVFEITDFNIWGDSWFGAYNVGWKYADGFDAESITALEVGMKDSAGNLIVRYTADANQLAWQKANGYITDAGLSSAPFYKEYNGTALAEGRDDDWTAEKGSAFDKWDVHTCYVKVTISEQTFELTSNCTHVHSYTEETVSETAWKSGATYYKTCPDCGAISSSDNDTFTFNQVAITDFNIWGDSWFGAYNVGWKYADGFETSTITALEVGMKDSAGNLIVRYTADANQLAWQKANGYITDAGLSSAPFYKEYNGTALVEGRDDDWTVEKGIAFDKWDVHTCYVKVTVNAQTIELTSDCTHVHSYTGEIVSNFALKSAATTTSPAVYYKTCPACGAISSTETFNYGSPLSGGGGSSGGGGGGSSTPTYKPDVPKSDNGTVTVTPSSPRQGDKVRIAPNPNEGYEVDKIIVTDKDGKSVEVTANKDGTFTFVQPDGKVKIEVIYRPETVEETGFVDVPANAYFADAVQWAVDKKITTGTSATTFSPNASCTRGQMVTFLWRAAGSPAATGESPFTDVKADAYYYDAVLWAVQKGITTGVTATTFAPDATVTRGQTVTFLYRNAGTPAATGNAFTDVSADAYYANAVAWAVAEKITNGTSATTFSPESDCTRGQIVTFLYRDAT